jgi:AcrR family transcriptional regulator
MFQEMSQRHEAAQDRDPVLDAARECVLAVGVRRTTFSDVARRAGVSRMTLYRRFGDLEALLSALMTREFGRLVGRTSGGSTRGEIVAMVVATARGLAGDPLFRRLLDVDPELLLPYVTQRRGGVQRLAVAALEDALESADSSVRGGASAAAVEVAARGFVLGARAEEPPDWRELDRLVDGYLRP